METAGNGIDRAVNTFGELPPSRGGLPVTTQALLR
jgi:hypothetical protein